MSLADEYARQREWRDWRAIMAALPPLDGRLVLDLGCAIGDQAAELAARGARVLGVDLNEALLDHARARSIDGAEFRLHDLRALPELGVRADGAWASFVAAYFPADLPEALRSWARHVRPGGWVALTEIDDLFGHEPLSSEAKAIFDAYARDALAAKLYDFHMGRKLRGYLRESGFEVSKELVVEDRELSFSGPAEPAVLDAWRARLDRLALLHTIAGASYERVRDELLATLVRPDHRATARVYCCIASTQGP